MAAGRIRTAFSGKGQAETHLPQPMHFSAFKTALSSSSISVTVTAPFGQTSAHNPQPTHFSRENSARPILLFCFFFKDKAVNAPVGQTELQLLQSYKQ